MKSASSVALFAAAGLFVGGVAMPSAKAADLGGDCCADLEERVAELEATTARKGTRQVSLTISGQVTRSILYWNSDVAGPVSKNTSGTYAGIDNHNQSTRFTFSGSAKITPNLKAGFEFMTEIATGPRTSNVDQDNVDGSASGDAGLAVRTANWYLEHSQLGRVTVGRLNFGGPVGTIDLAGVSTAAHFSPALVGGGFFVNGSARLNAFVGPTYGGDRIEGIRYDSPSIGGFVAQASWGENDVWSASLRYAGEFSGFRVAAGIGYQRQDLDTKNSGTDGLDFTPSSLSPPRAENEWSASLAVMHVPSGLFIQGHYGRSEFELGTGGTAQNTDARFWLVQGGITKNWFGLGNTSLYGEYGNGQDFAKSVFVNVLDSEARLFGVGVVQQIDSAAMELFLGWRRFETDLTPTPGTTTSSGDIDLVHGGARIRF